MRSKEFWESVPDFRVGVPDPRFIGIWDPELMEIIRSGDHSLARAAAKELKRRRIVRENLLRPL